MRRERITPAPFAPSRLRENEAASGSREGAKARRRTPVSSSHPEQPELRALRDRRVEAGAEGQAQHVPRLDRVDDAVVPQAGGGVVWVALVLVALADRGLERF